MHRPRARWLLALLLPAAVAAAAVEVTETEPDSFQEGQDLGTLGAEGILVHGVLDPTSPTGTDPGDRDGFSFTPAVDGPLTAVVDDGGAGTTFVLALSEATADGPVLRAADIGPAPLALVRPGLRSGVTYTVGVAALAGGAPLAYSLSLDPSGELPPWNGEICATVTADQEPNPAPDRATDLGDTVGVLCGSGSLFSVAPEGSEEPGDLDLFRFRAVLSVPFRLTVRADPGTVVAEVRQLAFVGTLPVASLAFGEEGVLELPSLEPGAAYFVQLRATLGTAPLDYTFHLEPVAGGPEEEPRALELERAKVRFDPAGKKARFSARARFPTGTGSGLGPAVPLAYRLRELEQEFAAGALTEDARGRLVYRGPPGIPGLRKLVFDPFRGLLTLKGKGLDPGGAASDPTVDLEVTLGDLVLRGEREGVFAGGGKRLKLKR